MQRKPSSTWPRVFVEREVAAPGRSSLGAQPDQPHEEVLDEGEGGPSEDVKKMVAAETDSANVGFRLKINIKANMVEFI